MACEYTFRTRCRWGHLLNQVTKAGKPLHKGAALLFGVPALALALQGPAPAAGVPPPVAASGLGTITTEGLIKLDVVVTGKEGKPVSGLEPRDFTLLDNEHPQKILSFQAVSGKTTQPDPPGEVILVIDTMNLPTSQVPLAKSEAEKFLRRNHGHLAQPVSLYLLSSAGLSSMPEPSIDGNALADEIARGRELPVVRLTPDPCGSAKFIWQMSATLLHPDFADHNLSSRKEPLGLLLSWRSAGSPVESCCFG